MDFAPTLDEPRWVDHAARFAGAEEASRIFTRATSALDGGITPRHGRRSRLRDHAEEEHHEATHDDGDVWGRWEWGSWPG